MGNQAASASLLGFLHSLIPRGYSFLIAAAIAAGIFAAAAIAVRRRQRWIIGYEKYVPGALAALTTALGILNIASAVTPRFALRLAVLERLSPLEVRHASHLIVLLAGLLLVYLARGLARRKSTAWVLATLLLLVSSAAHLVKGIDWEESTASAGLAALFFIARPSFHAASDRPSFRQGLIMAAAGSLGTLFLGTAGFRALAARRGSPLSIADAFRAAVNVLVEGDALPFQPQGPFERFFMDSLIAVAISASVAAVFLLLRPVLLKSPATTEARLRASDIVSRWGESVLDHFALFEDKHYVFSPGGSVTAFAVIGRRAVALRSPIGPEADHAAAAAGYLAACVRNDWEPSFYQASESRLDALKSAGFEKALRIGQEAIVDLETFSMTGKRSQDLRTALHRISREGGRISLFPPPHPAGLVSSLRPVSDEWISARRGIEQQFALGRFEEAYLEGCVLAVAFDPQDRPQAFVSLLPEYSSGRIAVDLMRSARSSPKGTTDALVATALTWSQEAGYRRFNLGLGAFASVGEGSEDPLLDQAIARVMPILERFYGFSGLETFKNKFDPVWEPRYLVCRTQAALVPSLFAVAQAHLGVPLLPFALAAALRLPRPEKAIATS